MALSPSTRQVLSYLTYGSSNYITTGIPIGESMPYTDVEETSSGGTGSRGWYTIHFVRTFSYTYGNYTIKFVDYCNVSKNWPDNTYNACKRAVSVLGSLTVNTSTAYTLYVSGTQQPVYQYGTANWNYYALTFSVSASKVNNIQVGNVALYVNNTLVAGSESKTINSNAQSISYSYNTPDTNTSNLPTVRIVSTACVNSISLWHNNYYYNGINLNGSAISDNNINFSENVATTYNITPSNNSTVYVANYGKKYKLTIDSVGTGVSSFSIETTRSHSTGNYVTTSTSPLSISSSGSLYVEYGRSVGFYANTSSGYVFSTSNGFISETSGVSSIFGNNSSSLIAQSGILTMIKDCTFDITCSSYTISVSISGHSDWGSVYIDSSGTTSKRITANTTYTFGFISSRANKEAPTVLSWYVNGSAITGNTYTSGSTLTGNISVTCTLQQNAYLVTVRAADSNGTVVVAGRYNKTSGASINTGSSNSGECYLRADATDYMNLAVTPHVHYSEVSSSRVISNLSQYQYGGTYAYSLSSANTGSASFYFSLSECVIKTSTNDMTLCDVTPSSATLKFNPSSGDPQFVNVYCQIKTAYINDYRVDYFTAGSAQYTAEVGGTGQYYYTVSPSILGGNSELTFIPHLVSTSNTLTVTKSGSYSFAVAYVSVAGVEEQISGSEWQGQVRENRAVICRAVASFGGIISSISTSGILDPVIDIPQVSFSMPSNNASVNIVVAERDKVSLSLAVSNITNPDVAAGKITLSCVYSSSVHEEVDTISPRTFLIYKQTTYHLVASDDDDTYTFSGWYRNNTYISSNLAIDINLSDLSTSYVAKYVMRTSGTITTSYGIKSGDQVIPTTLPVSSQPFGVRIDTAPDQTNPNKWIIGNSRYIQFTVLDDGISIESETRGGVTVQVTYVWIPVRVEVMANNGSDTWSTIWTYDANNPTSRTGRFVMRDNMLVRLVFTKFEAEGYGRVQALFLPGNTSDMGTLSIYATSMLTYYSVGGVAEASCLTGKKAVLTASPMPGYSFNAWYMLVGESYQIVPSNGAVLTIDQVSSSGSTYYADFSRSFSEIQSWNDGSIPKMFEWRSKVYVGSQFIYVRNVRIYSDVYPVQMTIMTASSPSECFDSDARSLQLVIQDQSPRNIPVMKLEKYFAFSVRGCGRINHVALASSMSGLK